MENKKNKLTIKQRKWIKKYIETGNATEAAMQAYNCKDRESAGTIGSENLQKLAFSELMDEMGLTDIALINIGTEGIRAKKSTATGEMVPDYNVRHKYWDTLLKLKGKLSDKNITAAQVNVKPILGGIAEGINTQTTDGDSENSRVT